MLGVTRLFNGTRESARDAEGSPHASTYSELIFMLDVVPSKVLLARNPGKCEIDLGPASVDRGFETKDRIAVVQLLAYFLAEYPRKIIFAVGPNFHVTDFICDAPLERLFHGKKLRNVVRAAFLVFVDENVSLVIRDHCNHLALRAIALFVSGATTIGIKNGPMHVPILPMFWDTDQIFLPP